MVYMFLHAICTGVNNDILLVLQFFRYCAMADDVAGTAQNVGSNMLKQALLAEGRIVLCANRLADCIQI